MWREETVGAARPAAKQEGFTFDAALDGVRSYGTGVAAMRETGVRAGAYKPLTDQERRWATEGPVPVAALDSVIADLEETG